MIFRTRRNGPPARINIGKSIETKISMKYLDVIVDERWTMRDHFYYITEKGDRIIKQIGRIMLNIRGLKENRR